MIDTLLYYGYNPACSSAGLSNDIVNTTCPEPLESNYSELLSQGVQAFRDALNAEIQRAQGGHNNIIPLSAGLDSRAILAGLVNHPDIDNRSITTVTFGIPGTFDFEIGQQVANAANVTNRTFDLSSDQFDWSESSLRNFAQKLECPTRIFESYVNYRVSTYFGDDSVIWSGFMGDPSVGGHQPDQIHNSWTKARKNFAKKNRFTKGFAKQTYDPLQCLPNEPYLPNDLLSYEEQLDFAHRQSCFIRPTIHSGECDYVMPFVHPEWLEFSLNLPKEYRKNRSLFVDLMCQAYPELFSLPSDMKHGLRPDISQIRWYSKLAKSSLVRTISNMLDLEYIHPGTNYMNFDSELRSEGEFHQMAKSLIVDFGERTDIPARDVWNEHQTGSNRSKEIRSICSAELYLANSGTV